MQTTKCTDKYTIATFVKVIAILSAKSRREKSANYRRLFNKDSTVESYYIKIINPLTVSIFTLIAFTSVEKNMILDAVAFYIYARRIV